MECSHAATLRRLSQHSLKHLATTEEKRAEVYDRGHLKQDWAVCGRARRHPTMRFGTKFQPKSVGPYELRAAITGSEPRFYPRMDPSCPKFHLRN